MYQLLAPHVDYIPREKKPLAYTVLSAEEKTLLQVCGEAVPHQSSSADDQITTKPTPTCRKGRGQGQGSPAFFPCIFFPFFTASFGILKKYVVCLLLFGNCPRLEEFRTPNLAKTRRLANLVITVIEVSVVRIRQVTNTTRSIGVPTIWGSHKPTGIGHAATP